MPTEIVDGLLCACFEFDPYERAGSFDYYGVHDMFKLKRVGHGKIRDHLTREIRHRRTTLLQANALQNHYANTSVDIKSFIDWLDAISSGYQCFVEHQLAGVKHFIGEPDRLSYDDMDIPLDVSALLPERKSSGNEFIAFGKGIDNQTCR